MHAIYQFLQVLIHTVLTVRFSLDFSTVPFGIGKYADIYLTKFLIVG